MPFDQFDRLSNFRPGAFVVAVDLPQDDVGRAVSSLQHRRVHDVELLQDQNELSLTFLINIILNEIKFKIF